MTPEPALEARGVHKDFRRQRSEVRVLRGLDLEVTAGEFVAVTGASGSGKSTLLHVLGLMDEPSSGEVRLFGSPAPAGEPERARLRSACLGFVFQFDSMLPDFTLLENVTLPGRIARGQGRGPGEADARSRALELLGRFGLAEAAERFPLELSGGERQRAAVARALLNRPRILLADEPTGNLDSANGELVLKSMKQASEELGVAVVLVTHDERAARFAARVLKLSGGVLSPTDIPQPARPA